MEVIIYNNKLQFLGRYPQNNAPHLSQLKVENVVLAFDQSTTCTAITVGDNKGNIHGYLRLIRESKDEKGREFIANYHLWLEEFIDVKPNYIIYEYTFSKGYFNTDVILSQLRGTFPTLKKNLNWDFPVEYVMQQEWKSNLMKLKPGDRSFNKENVQHCVTTYVVPNIIDDDRFEDVYDSIGIYYYYVCTKMNKTLETPVIVTKKIKMKDSVDYNYTYCIGKEPELGTFSRIALNRGIRYFEYTRTMSPREHIARLATNSNELWICNVPITDNPFIDEILPQCTRLPNPDEFVYLMGYRVNKGNFKRTLL